MFHIYKLEYLGYIITESKIRMDPIKISIIKGWLTLRNISKVQLFLGFINFYRRFIKKYSEVAISLIKLTKKDQPWV